VRGRGSGVEKRGIRSVTASTYSRGEEEEGPNPIGLATGGASEPG
jgi:hypothetical protein